MAFALFHDLDFKHGGGKKRHAVVITQNAGTKHMHHGDNGDPEQGEKNKTARAEASPLIDEIQNIFKKSESESAHNGQFDHVVDGLKKAVGNKPHDPEL